MATIDLYFDFISHNAYLAWAKLPALAAAHGHTVRPVPVLFAGLLQHHGQLGPAEIPAKSRWMLRNVARKAAHHGIPFAPPASHPFVPLLALRAAIASGADHVVVGALFEATWASGRDVSDADTVRAVLDEAGVDGAALVARTQDPEVKAALRENTEQAIARGVFGVPTMCVGDALFYGFDDLPWLEAFLAGEDPIEGMDWSGWEAVTASARRPR